MTNDILDQLGQTLTQIGRLKEYLQSSVETSEGKVKVTIKNIAPEEMGLPLVVFTGVGLKISGADFNYWNAIQSNKITKDAGITRLHTEKYHRLANREFRSINSHESIQTAPYDKQTDDILFPGQWIQYEIDIPIEKAPYIELQIEGAVSPQHLFYSSTIFPVETSHFKAVAIEALKEYNVLEIHRALIDVTSLIPAFDDNTKFSEVQTFIDTLSSAITECDTLIETGKSLYYKYPFPWFQAHTHATFNYVNIVKETLNSIKEAITSNQQYEIITETSKLKTELVEEAYQLNKDTEEIMTRFQIIDEEVGYKYRYGIENWDKAAVQRLQTVFSEPKLWSLLPERARRSMIDADRSWSSGSSARPESILNDLRIATEQLLLEGLWDRLEGSEAFQNAQEYHKDKYWNLKAEFLESGAQPSLLCLQRVCSLQVTPAYLQAKGISEKDIKWFTEQLPESLHHLRQARNKAEHEIAQMSREELQPFVDEFLIKGSQGILFRIAKILLD